MDDKELIFQQYRLYSEQKESFISRSFAINRFYLCLAIILLILVNIFKGVMFAYMLPLSVLLSVIGMGTTILWWMNMDSYNMLIKIKFSKVLEQIEKQLPVQPYGDEYKGIEEFRTNKKMFLFSDMQKAFSVLIFLMFFISMIESIVPLLIKRFI